MFTAETTKLKGTLASSLGSLYCITTTSAAAVTAVVATAVVGLRLGDGILAAGASQSRQLPVHLEQRRP